MGACVYMCDQTVAPFDLSSLSTFRKSRLVNVFPEARERLAWKFKLSAIWSLVTHSGDHCLIVSSGWMDGRMERWEMCMTRFSRTLGLICWECPHVPKRCVELLGQQMVKTHFWRTAENDAALSTNSDNQLIKWVTFQASYFRRDFLRETKTFICRSDPTFSKYETSVLIAKYLILKRDGILCVTSRSY